MKKIKTISLILFLVVLHSISAEAILGPAMGMMNTHPMAPQKDSVYTDIINDNTGGDTNRFNELGIAIATSENGDEVDWEQYEISIKSNDSELVFVSDENPVYKRPFKLYLLQRGVKTTDPAFTNPREKIRRMGSDSL